ncbi:unnamed protein product [Mytilus coruscus]|uniref:Uncharacterized protein n=1 Tax=Mytilus coruscus TaxID=42192 RepID=A0A6J8C666_MYTCO|nr:unnamed protein product [Mytilus coruscus]
MRGEYHYPEEEGFLCENIDEVKEDKTSKGQDDIANQLSNDINETGNELDENGNESGENSQILNNEAVTETKKQDFGQNAVVPIESSDSPPWIASETLICLPEVKADESSVIRYSFTTRPSSMAHIHQTGKPTWFDISLKKEIVLDVPDKSERKVMKKEEKKKGTGTNNLLKDAKKRRQTEDNLHKKKHTNGLTKVQINGKGKGAVDHHQFISDSDLESVYAYLDSWRTTNSAKILQHKVFVDVMLHFGRRGWENLRDLQRDDFAVTSDGQGALYAYKVRNEQTKNHQTDDAKSEGRMYEIKGHNYLGSVMKKISAAAKLSIFYTNHSLRATTVHVLDVAQFQNRHIMSLTGHISENSLKTYTGQTSEETKKRMPDTLNKKTNATNKVFKTTISTYTATTAISDLNYHSTELMTLSCSKEQVLLADVSDSTDPELFNDELNDILKTYDLVREVVPVQTTDNAPVNAIPQRAPMMPMPNLYNCSNITFNYNFNIQK